MLGMKARGIDNPYFRVNEGTNSNGVNAESREYITFSRYNYLGMSGDPAEFKPPKTRSTVTVRPFPQAVLFQAKGRCIVSLRKKLQISLEQRTALFL